MTAKQRKITMMLLLGSLLWAFHAARGDEYYGRDLCGYPEFNCVKVHHGDTWESLFPDEHDREVVKRLNRTNIELTSRSWIVVPNDLDEVNYLDLSPFPAHIKPQGERVVLVNLGLQAFGAYNRGGQLIHWGPVSGGKGWCPDINRSCHTLTGSFRIIRKQGPECVSSKFPIEEDGGAPMPYCMHYFEGFALHGSPTLPGYPASHGCVRLFEEDAQWLNEQFTKIGTRVVVMQ